MDETKEETVNSVHTNLDFEKYKASILEFMLDLLRAGDDNDRAFKVKQKADRYSKALYAAFDEEEVLDTIPILIAIHGLLLNALENVFISSTQNEEGENDGETGSSSDESKPVKPEGCAD